MINNIYPLNLKSYVMIVKNIPKQTDLHKN